ncbi:MAG TPA: amino acid adenylation domain-containing protein, partial [Thermoanaerobaculia bacterium]|nr:amino acid adenylation domain-containing protein [Thermoanaerobaculia bacterium]
IAEGGHGGDLGDPLDTTFRDFVALERETLASADQRRYWAAALGGAEAALLPSWPASGVAPASGHFPVPVPSGISDGLKRLAAEAGVPMKSVLLAAHLKAVGRLLGQREVLTGLVVNGRPETQDAEQALGLFLNTVPLRRPLSAGSWTELARAAFAAESEILPFRRFPLAELHRLPGIDLAFNTCFNYTHFHAWREIGQASELQVLGMEELAATNFALTADFSLDPGTSAVQLRLQYDPAQVSEEQIHSLAGLYARILAAMVADPGQAAESQPLLAAAERQQTLAEWNDTAARLAEASFHELFAARAAATPEATAVVCQGESWTYRELNRRANQLAARLRALGVGPEVRVGLCSERSPEMLAALLAVLKAGGAYLPLDPSSPPERLAFLLADAQPAALLAPPALAARLGAALPCLWIEAGTGVDAGDPESSAGPENLAYILYTSGSTGRPKGVMVHHGGLANYLAWAVRAYGLTPRSRVPVHSPLSFDLTVTALLAPLAAGGQVHLLPEEGGVDGLARALRERSWDLVKLTPAHLQVLDEQLGEGTGESAEGRQGATFVIGGEALTWESLERWRQRAPHARLINEYGPTEAVVGCCTFEVPPFAHETGAVPIGRPIAETRLYLLDPQGMPVPLGTAGELYIGGAGVTRGYLGRPDLTAERFVPDPFAAEPGERLYHSGDRARHRLDGTLEFLGRSDELVKIRGFRVEPGEVAANLLAHPALSAAVVLPQRAAQGLELQAYLVAMGDRPSLAELRGFLRERLPEPMLP